MTKGRKLDAVTERQAIAFVRRYIELNGLFSDRELWRTASKQELCGQPELPDELVRKRKEWISQLPQLKARLASVIPPEDLDRRITDIQRALEASISKRPLTWNKEKGAKVIADAERGDALSDQVLREVAAMFLERGELPPKPLLDYAATSLRAPSGRTKRKQASPNPGRKKPTQPSPKTERRNRRLAGVVYAVSQKFGLSPTRNRDPKNTKNDDRGDCACSIVAKAIKKSEDSVRQIWEKNNDFDHNAPDLFVEFIESESLLPSDWSPSGYR
jgi:hypothetical protein